MKNKTENKITDAPAWDLSDLFSGIDDPEVERTIKDTLERAKRFEEMYRGKINPPEGSLTPQLLLNATKELESIEEQMERLDCYAYLIFAQDTNKSEYGAFMQKIKEKIVEINKHLIFFGLEWLKVSNETAKNLMNDNLLDHYRYFLENERRRVPHVLSEPEEKILEEKASTGSYAFKRLFDEVVNNIKFNVDGKDLTESEALALLYHPDRTKRINAAEGFTRGLQSNSHVLTYIFNTLTQDSATDDRLRKYLGLMDSRHLDNQINKATVDAMMVSCENNYEIVTRYHQLKKRILGLEKLYDYDRYAPIVLHDAETEIDFARAKEIVLKSFGDFSPLVAEIAQKFFDKKWIDAQLRPWKRSGGFSHSCVPSVHPYILVNYSNNLRDAMVVAHELGHGVHQFLAGKQGFLLQNTPLTTAETASVFGEILVFHNLKEAEKDPGAKLTLLCGKIEEMFATCFRQVVLTRFEENLHTARRVQGELKTEEINKLWTDANKAMFGDSVELTGNYGYWWMYIPHFIHSPFYCYAYSFGMLLVLALYQKYLQEGGKFIPRYLELLKAGGSEMPSKLLMKTVGVNISDPNFWQGGHDVMKAMVREAEELFEAINK